MQTMTSKKQINLEQRLPEGQIVNRAWLNIRGFNRAKRRQAVARLKKVLLYKGA